VDRAYPPEQLHIAQFAHARRSAPAPPVVVGRRLLADGPEDGLDPEGVLVLVNEL
jgi:hypothetical protein